MAQNNLLEKSYVMNVKPARNNNIDVFRLIAALGVIAIHVHSDAPEILYLDKSLNPLCVSFFYLISAIFFIQNIPKYTFTEIMQNIGSRILTPFISWTIIYVLMLYIKSIITHKVFSIVVWRTVFYGESAMHMYYLPSLIILQLMILATYYLLLKGGGNKGIAALLFAGTITYLWIGDYYNCFGVSQSGKVISFILFSGVAFWMAPRLRKLSHTVSVFLTGLVGLLGVLLLNWFDYRMTVLEYPMLNVLGGISGVLICLGAPKIHIPKWLIVMSATSYGIYLSHVVFLEALEFCIEKFMPSLYVSVLLKLLFVLLICVCAVIFTFTIRKTPILRKILLGEN